MATSNDLNISQAGYVVFDGTATFAGRTFQAGTGITLTNANGVSGNTTITANGANDLHTAKFIVSSEGTLGTGANFTTITAAIASAQGTGLNSTIFIMPGTYTENITLVPGINLTAFGCDSSLNGTGRVIISGTCTMTAAGSVTISGIQLQTNSAALLAVTGTLASVVNLNNCYLNCTNATGITYSSSNASSAVNLFNCNGNLGTTGIALFSHSSSGALSFNSCNFQNTGGSSTASTASAGSCNIGFSAFSNPITTSSTAGIIFNQSSNGTGAQNVTALTVGGSGTNRAGPAIFSSGSASCVSIGGTLTMSQCEVNTSNTNAVTGAGTLIYTPLQFTGSGKAINTTTQTPANYGTWTPTIVGTVTGVTTYTTQQGYYTIVGNALLIEAIITITAATGTGTAIVGGFPFTIKNLANYFPIGTLQIAASGTWLLPATTTCTFLRGIANGTTANIGASGTGSVGNVQMSNGAASFVLSMWYQI